MTGHVSALNPKFFRFAAGVSRSIVRAAINLMVRLDADV